jgi:hypothetical protein
MTGHTGQRRQTPPPICRAVRKLYYDGLRLMRGEFCAHSHESSPIGAAIPVRIRSINELPFRHRRPASWELKANLFVAFEHGGDVERANEHSTAR